MADRVQIAMIIGDVPTDGSGNVNILYANEPACELFGYTKASDMVGCDVRSLMAPEIANGHKGHVAGYVTQSKTKGGTVMMRANKTRIMGSWRNLQGVRLDGSSVEIQVHVADIKNDEEQYFVGFFRDRTGEVGREEELAEALESAHDARNDAQVRLAQLDEARTDAEAGLQRQETLTKQVSLLLDNLGTSRRSGDQADRRNMGTGFDRRQMYVILLFVIVTMGLATVLLGGLPMETLHVAERILLVLTGVVAALTAGVLDPRNKK
jgi:PAS domain S-box-containing protein